MKSPIEVMLEKGLISELYINKGHYEFTSEDPSKLNAAFKAYSDQFKAMWTETKHRLPEIGETILVWNGRLIEIAKWVDGKFRKNCDGSDIVDVSHWMAFPYPPGLVY